MAWIVIQGAYVYLGLIWHGLAGESLAPGAIETHGRQFLALRRIQVATWIGTGVAFLLWLRRARETARALDGAAVRWGWLGVLVLPGLTVAAALAHALAAALAADRLRPLDLGGPMQSLVLGALLEIAAAVLAIVLVRRITRDLEERRRELT
ncbi:MAG TPA: hypothetical protein VLK35_02670 [Methylomirabilota bacterium]|nr:hypothetical protein [Methylomirabilota bacterium]